MSKNLKRKQSNIEILDYLRKRVSEWPDARFKQLLIVENIIKDNHNDFNEESVTTLRKLKKEYEKSISCVEKPELFVCRSSSSEYGFAIECCKDKVFAELLPYPESFWGRIISSIKYVLGKHVSVGLKVELSSLDADRLQEIVDYLRTLK